MRTWIEYLTPQQLKESDILNTAYAHHEDFSNVFSLIENFCAKSGKWKELRARGDEDNITIELHSSNETNAQISILPSERRIFVKEYFFFTLIGQTKSETYLFLIYLYFSIHNKFPDLHIDLYQESERYIETKKQKLSREELAALQLTNHTREMLHIRGLCFVSIVKYDNFSRKTLFEKKIVRDIAGTANAKKILGLDENAYAYIEKKDMYESDKDEEREKFRVLKNEFHQKKIDFEEYAHSHIDQKNLFLWIWWTISPFVSADIAILLPMLYEAKKIKKIYIDLCRESNSMIQDYVSGGNISEEAIEDEIKKTYPPIIKDYQKETLPYLVLLNKMRELNIAVECFGMTGTELLNIEPSIKDSHKIEYPSDISWKKSVLSEYKNLDKYDKDEMTIFFYYMKPMYPVPVQIRDTRVEKIIHTDKFTGYGPQKPENSLAIYSHYSSSSQRSFIIPEVSETPLKEELVVYYPYMEADETSPALEDSKFNRFKLYDTMIYSSHGGGGGGGKREALNPVDADYQPVD